MRRPWLAWTVPRMPTRSSIWPVSRRALDITCRTTFSIDGAGMMDRKKESIEPRLVTRLLVAEEVEGQKEWTVFCRLRWGCT